MPASDSSGLRGRRVVVAGATGFVGRCLCARLRDAGADVVGLGRSVADGERDGITWRRCDLFSLLQVEQALQGADVVYYLVHSMLPSARLTQARFEDMDLMLADNVARAAADTGVDRIVYLGGILPDMPRDRLSRHLRSRLEVESALAGHGVDVTAVRAGLVIGPEGSSFRILRRLVERLPLMILPPWTDTPTQPTWLLDVVEVLARVVEQDLARGRAVDVGGPEQLTYADLIGRMAAALGRERRLIPVPWGPASLSELWVSLVTGTPRALVAPLVESLAHPMLASTGQDVVDAVGLAPVGVDEALRRAVAGEVPPLPEPARTTTARLKEQRRVRSVQRLPLPAEVDGGDPTAPWASDEYLRWLPRFLLPLLRVRREDDDTACIELRGVGRCLLALQPSEDRSSRDRALLYVTGGMLARRPTGRGRLELRVVDEDTDGGQVLLAAIHDFSPRLPWAVYVATQAQAHAFVMWAFGRHLARLAGAGDVARVGRGPA